MSAKITYNSKTTEVANGKIATLSCSGKKMTTDVVIEIPKATDSPLPTEVSTEAEMTALLTSGEVGGVYKYTGTTGTYENGALYVLEEETGATVTITNTSTTLEGAVRLVNGGDILSNIGKNSTITITVPIGETIELFVTSEAWVPMWWHTSLTGDIVHDGLYGYTINGDGTIVGYMHDAD